MNQKSYLDGLIHVKNKGADVSVLCFSGPVSGDRFHFFRSFDDIDVNVIYVKESIPGWFQYGLPGAEGYLGLKIFLESLLKELGSKKLYCYGASMGGYGALLYGTLLDAKRILTFGARSYIHPNFVTNSKVIVEKGVNESISKLYPLVRSYVEDGGSVINVCGEDEWLDIFHLSRISRISGVMSLTIPDAGHNVGAWLKANNCLNEFLVKALIDGDCDIAISVNSFVFSDNCALGQIVDFIKKYHSGDINSSKTVASSIIEQYPLWGMAYFHVALTGYLLNDLEFSVTHNTRSLELQPSNLKSLYLDGKLNMKSSNWEKAIIRFQRVLEAKPTLDRPIVLRKAYYGLAYSFKMTSNAEEALKYLILGNEIVPKKKITIDDLTFNKSVLF